MEKRHDDTHAHGAGVDVDTRILLTGRAKSSQSHLAFPSLRTTVADRNRRNRSNGYGKIAWESSGRHWWHQRHWTRRGKLLWPKVPMSSSQDAGSKNSTMRWRSIGNNVSAFKET